MCGSASAEEKMDSMRAFGAGMCVFGKMDGSRCPRRDAAQCSSIAVSGLLGDGAWHSHSAPAAPARPHPGPWQPFAGPRSCLYLVGLLWRDQRGAGHLRIRVAAFALGVTSPAPPVGCGDQGTPCSSDAGRSCWPADAEGSRLHGREGLQNDNPGCEAFGVDLPISVHLPYTVATNQTGIDSIICGKLVFIN